MQSRAFPRSESPFNALPKRSLLKRQKKRGKKYFSRRPEFEKVVQRKGREERTTAFWVIVRSKKKAESRDLIKTPVVESSQNAKLIRRKKKG